MAHEEISSKKCIIVVARYMEKLEWLNKYPFNQYKVIIYNKGNNNDFIKTKNILEIISLPNVGRESHTYLYHILNTHNKYNPLVTCFFSGSLEVKNKNDDALVICNILENTEYKSSVFSGRLYNKIAMKKTFSYIQEKYTSSSIENSKFNITSNVFPATKRPFIKWLKYININKYMNFISLYGNFAIHKSVIAQHSKQYYNRLINELQPTILSPDMLKQYSNPETGFFFERTWTSLFYSPNNIMFDWKQNRIIDINEETFIRDKPDNMLHVKYDEAYKKIQKIKP